MAGGSFYHGAVAANLTGVLRQHLRGKPCIVDTADLRINVSNSGLFAYPDLSVVCGEPELLDAVRDTLLNPTLVPRCFRLQRKRTIAG